MLSRVQRNIFVWLLITAVVIAYANSFSVPFLFDDVESVIGNSSLRHLFQMTWLHPAASGTVGGRPLTNLTFAINYSLGALSPVGYHLGNLFVHCLSGLIIFGWLSELLLRPEFPLNVRRVAGYLAFVCAVLWLCHPVATYTVTYISQRSEGLMSLCYLAVLYSFWKWRTDPSKIEWQYTAVLFCFAGMACKEGMATAPVMVWLMDRTFFTGSFLRAIRLRTGFYFTLGCSWILLLSLYFTTQSRGVGLGGGVTWIQYVLTESRVVLLYLKLVFIPSPLVFDYAATLYRREIDQLPYFGLLILILLATLYLLWKKPLVGFAIAWFFLLLAPTSSIIPIASQPMGENRMYLALLGPLVLTVITVYRSLRWASWPAFALLACCAIQQVISRNQICASPVSLWLDTIQKVPTNARAEFELGEAFIAEQRFEEADRAFDKAIEIDPDLPDPYSNKGDVALLRGEPFQAEKWYRIAVEKNPRRFDIWRNFGGVLFENGKLAGAAQAFQRALDLRPDDALAVAGLGSVAQAQGKTAEAIVYFKRSVDLDPQLAIPHNNLGSALLMAGQTEEAFGEFKTAVILKPNLSRPHTNLATMYARQGNFPEAILHYLRALQISPQDNEARTNLGLAYQLSGQPAIAEACYRAVLRKNPQDLRARNLSARLIEVQAQMKQSGAKK